MSKQVTVLLPHVPVEFKHALEAFRPPGMTHATATTLTKGVIDLELTFTSDGLPPEREADFGRDSKGAALIALIMFLESYPQLITRVLIYLISHKVGDWRERADKAQEKDDPEKYLREWLIHDLIVQGGDLLGIDHRPCWDAGKCLHDSNGGK